MIAIDCKSQSVIINDDCNGGLNIRTRFFEKFPFYNYKEFIKKYFSPNEQKYFSKKSDLIQVLPLINIENKVSFTYKDLNLCLLLKDTMVLDTYDMEYFYNLPAIEYYGNIYGGKHKIIDSLYFIIGNNRKEIIPKYLFHDLLDININQVYKSYRPIEFYYDKKLKSLCIYITGRLDLLEGESKSIDGSYIAKFIIDIKTKKVKRIVLPSCFAFSYGYLYCDNFWPF